MERTKPHRRRPPRKVSHKLTTYYHKLTTYYQKLTNIAYSKFLAFFVIFPHIFFAPNP